MLCRDVLYRLAARGTNMARVIGMGGVFFKARDPKGLSAWYRDTLGLPVESWGGVLFSPQAGPPHLVLSPFEASSDYFEPSAREFMLNFAVDDLDDLLAVLESKGVKPLRRDDSDPNGRFAWIMDPEGTKIELWEPGSEQAS